MTLSNHLIFILSVYSLVSCTQIQKSPRRGGDCKESDNELIERHLVLSAKNQKQKNLVACFQNYLKFEENKKQLVSTCNYLKIRRNGTVASALTMKGPDGKLPKDVQWCMEQEFWKMNFSGLQLDKTYEIVFPLNLSSH